MYQLLETIKIANNTLQNIRYHNIRVNHSRRSLFQSNDEWDLSRLIAIPDLDPERIYRCRFLYSRDIGKIEFHPYTPRIIRTLFLVTADELDYSHKYANRDALEKLRNQYGPEQDSDILIVKNGLVTDTSFSNIALFDGAKWYTPSLPLLKGTKRACYLEKGVLSEKEIRPADLYKYKKIRLINAMLDLDDGRDITIRIPENQ